jgi:hypothetical protein
VRVQAGLTFIITLLGNWFGRNFSGYQKRGCVVVFILFDVLCIGMQVPAIATLAVAGVPSNCGGLTSGGCALPIPIQLQLEFRTEPLTDILQPIERSKGLQLLGLGTVETAKGSWTSIAMRRGLTFSSQSSSCKWSPYTVASRVCANLCPSVLFFYTTSLSIRLMALLHRRAKELKVQRKAGEELAQIELGPVTPEPQLAPAETPAPVARSPPQKSSSNIVAQERNLSNDDIVALEATISDGFWVSRSPDMSTDPPPYMPDQEAAKQSFGKS